MFVSRRRHESIYKGGGALGPELLVNGDFNAGATSWTVTGNDATHIATFDGATLRYQSDTTSPNLTIAQNAVMTIGKTYRITAVCSAFVSGSVAVGGIGGSTVAVGAAGTFSITVAAASANFTISRTSSNVDLTLDSVSVRQVGP